MGIARGRRVVRVRKISWNESKVKIDSACGIVDCRCFVTVQLFDGDERVEEQVIADSM